MRPGLPHFRREPRSVGRADWRFDSSPAELKAFKAGIARPVYASGLMPADIKGNVRLMKGG
jgi:hypothetical protein